MIGWEEMKKSSVLLLQRENRQAHIAMFYGADNIAANPAQRQTAHRDAPDWKKCSKYNYYKSIVGGIGKEPFQKARPGYIAMFNVAE